MRGVKPQDSNRRARGRRKHRPARPGDHARETLLMLRKLREDAVKRGERA